MGYTSKSHGFSTCFPIWSMGKLPWIGDQSPIFRHINWYPFPQISTARKLFVFGHFVSHSTLLVERRRCFLDFFGETAWGETLVFGILVGWNCWHKQSEVRLTSICWRFVFLIFPCVHPPFFGTGCFEWRKTAPICKSRLERGGYIKRPTSSKLGGFWSPTCCQSNLRKDLEAQCEDFYWIWGLNRAIMLAQFDQNQSTMDCIWPIFDVDVWKCGIPNLMVGWWFGTCFIFPYSGNVIIPGDFHIFQMGWWLNHQPDGEKDLGWWTSGWFQPTHIPFFRNSRNRLIRKTQQSPAKWYLKNWKLKMFHSLHSPILEIIKINK